MLAHRTNSQQQQKERQPPQHPEEHTSSPSPSSSSCGLSFPRYLDPSSSAASFTAVPLSPNPSQSHFSTPPPAQQSSVDSSPVYLTINSPADDGFSSTVALFHPSASYSMIEDFSDLTSNLSSAISPIELYNHGTGNGALDPQDIDGGMFLQNNLPFDYIGCDDYTPILSHIRFNTYDSNPNYFYQYQQQQQQHSGKAFPSHQNIINDGLQVAHQRHVPAQAQAAQDARRSSPFHQGSPFAQPTSSYHRAHLQQPPQLSPELPQSGLRGMTLMNGKRAEPKAIFPKEVLLEYHDSSEETNPPLFPAQPDPSQHNLAQPSTGVGQNCMAMDQLPNQYAQLQQSPQQYFLQQRAQQQQQQQCQPTATVQHRESQRLPIHNAASANGSSADEHQKDMTAMATEGIRRPEDTSSDSGTYSCTYHWCTLRFDSPARLQKHKREAHRQITPGTRGLLRHSSGGPMRNSQAGPHKCERINPSTGKPCNSIFSRPYDLTRHEDTIHNTRKQKVRCHPCTEEKTFSRNDALTRHMRVVHPEVSWPGKRGRKGRG